jgi:integrase
MKEHREYGTGSIELRGTRLWIHYYKNGKKFSESTGSDKITRAQAMLRKRLGEIAVGEFVTPADRRVTVDELYEGLLWDYRDKANLHKITEYWQNPKHPEKPGRLKAFFGGMRASQVTTELLRKFVEQCEKDKLRPSSINRLLSTLRHAFYLGYKCTPRKIQQVPVFPMQKEKGNERQGFVEQSEYDALCKQAGGELWLRTLLALAYTYGIRKGELLNLRCSQVDLAGHVLRLHKTKNGKPRHAVLTTECFTLVQACMMGKAADDYLFTYPNGDRVRDFRKPWARITKAAGVPNLLFHDLRRSGVRGMVRSGISQHVAMKISGHETESTFRRYDIGDDKDLIEAARLIELRQTEQRQAASENMHKTYTIEGEEDASLPLTN